MIKKYHRTCRQQAGSEAVTTVYKFSAFFTTEIYKQMKIMIRVNHKKIMQLH
jgi:hypothetical protein